MSCVYTLELEHGKYYVGSTTDIATRIAQHWLLRGSLWTREHPPVRVLQVIDGDRRTEDAVTVAMMVKHGWRNVRGGSWCSLELLGMPDPIARAFARSPPRPGRERDERVIFDYDGQAVALLKTDDGWTARVTGPLAVTHNPSSGVVLLSAATQDGARARVIDWIAARSNGDSLGSAEGVEEMGSPSECSNG